MWSDSIDPCMHAVASLPPPTYGVILTYHGEKSRGRAYVSELPVVSISRINTLLGCDLILSNYVCIRWSAFLRQNLGSFWPLGKKLGSCICFGATRCQHLHNKHIASMWSDSIEPCMHAVVSLPPPNYGVILTPGEIVGVVYVFWSYPLSTFQNTHTTRMWSDFLEPCTHALVSLPPPTDGVILTTGKEVRFVYMFWVYFVR